MAVPAPAAARNRARPSPARVLLLCLHLTAAATLLVLGDWPQRLIAPVLLAAVGYRTALSRRPARAGPGRRQDRPPSSDRSRP
ncbi:hypothetical protein ACF061_25815 [Streptomyces sp. NPDC015220]|uniref:hypothetical protein n=1 Tax=Streptomyces sp. NPDC015220 TaxID=3364947 RepID=UPI003700096D